jgi:hypothetical protein
MSGKKREAALAANRAQDAALVTARRGKVVRFSMRVDIIPAMLFPEAVLVTARARARVLSCTSPCADQEN